MMVLTMVWKMVQLLIIQNFVIKNNIKYEGSSNIQGIYIPSLVHLQDWELWIFTVNKNKLNSTLSQWSVHHIAPKYILYEILTICIITRQNICDFQNMQDLNNNNTFEQLTNHNISFFISVSLFLPSYIGKATHYISQT